MRLPAASSSTLPRDLLLGAALGNLTRAFCAASKPLRWGRCRVLGFDCFGDGLHARQLIDSAALMGACFQAKRLASNLDLVSSSGSLPVQPGISGLGQLLSLDAKGRATAKRTKPKLIELQTQTGLGRSGLAYEWRRALKPDLGKVRERMSAASRKTAFDAA